MATRCGGRRYLWRKEVVKMKFSLNLAVILNEMRNDEGETLEDLGIDWRKVVDMIIRGNLQFDVESHATGDFLVIDIPNVEG